MKVFNFFLALVAVLNMSGLAAQDRIQGNKLTIGKKTSSTNKELCAEKGTGVQGCIRYNTTLDRWEQATSSGTFVELGAGGAGGTVAKNYASGGTFEADAGGATAYNDGATAIPVDAQNGSPTVTCTRTTSAPLRGTGSLLITVPASNSQGQGCSILLDALDTADKGSRVIVIADSEESANMIAGDVGVFAIGVPSGTVFHASPVNVPDGRNGIYTVITPDNSTDTHLRLAFHIQTTKATGYTLKIDSLVVGKGTVNIGSVSTKYKNYTPTITGVGTPTGVSFFSRRNGPTMSIYGQFTTGTVSGVESTFTMPAGTTALAGTSAFTGRWYRSTSSGSTRKGGVLYANQNSNLIQFASDDYTTAAAPDSNLLGNAAFSTGQTIYVEIHGIPVTGWEETQTASTDSGARLLLTKAYRTGGSQAVAATTAVKVQLNASTVDYGGSLDVANNRIVIQETDCYRISGKLSFASFTANEVATLHLYKNGSPYQKTRATYNGTDWYATIVDEACHNKNDYFEMYAQSTADNSYTITGGTDETILNLSKIGGGNRQITYNEPIVASYSSNNGQSSANNGVVYEDKIEDTHGSYVAGVFTAQRTDRCKVYGNTRHAAIAYSNANNQVNLCIRKNSVDYACEQKRSLVAATVNHVNQVYAEVPVVQGDIITFHSVNEGPSPTLTTSGTDNFMHIYCPGR